MMARKVRVYVVSLVGTAHDLFLRSYQTDTILRRISDLRKGQKLTIRVVDMTPQAVAENEEFAGW